MASSSCFECENTACNVDMSINVLSPVTLSCSHTVCHCCAIKSLASSVGSGMVACPCCMFGVDCVTLDVKAKVERTRTKKVVVDTPEVIEVKSEFEPDPSYDPFCRIFKDWKETDAFAKEGYKGVIPEGGVLLSATRRLQLDESGSIEIDEADFVLSADGSSLPSKDDQDGLNATFAMYHCTLPSLSSQSNSNESEDEDRKGWLRRVKPLDELADYLDEKDRRIMPQCLLNLLVGADPNYSSETIRKTKLLHAHLLTDIILRSMDPQQEYGHVIDLINFLLECASRTEINDVLSRLRLVYTNDANIRNRGREFMETASKRYNIGPRDLLDMSADNIQYLHEWEGRYDHWYTNLYWEMGENDLVAAGILYDTPANPAKSPATVETESEAAAAADTVVAESPSAETGVTTTTTEAVSTSPAAAAEADPPADVEPPTSKPTAAEAQLTADNVAEAETGIGNHNDGGGGNDDNGHAAMDVDDDNMSPAEVFQNLQQLDRPLSREPRVDWDSFTKNMSVDAILDFAFRPGPKDHAARGEVILTHITLALGIIKDMPTLEEAKKMVETGNFHWEKQLPILYRFGCKEDADTSNIEATKKGNPTTSNAPTGWTWADLYEANKLIPSIPVHMNFSSNQACYGIAEHLERVSKAQLEAYEKIAEEREKKELPPLDPPPSVDVVLFEGDGAPVFALNNAKAEEAAKDNPRFKNIKPLAGAFHTKCHNFETTNEILEELVGFIADSFTAGHPIVKKDYLDPHDITGPEKQMCSIILAIIAHTINTMRDEGRTEVSAIEAWDYFRAQAEKCSVSMALLVLVEEYETVVLHRLSVRQNDFDKYVSANKLNMPACVGNHSTHYLQIKSYELQWVATRSEFEDMIHRAQGFTAKSENGESVAKDYVHEKYNGKVRKTTGKKVRRGHDARVEHASMTAKETSNVDVKSIIKLIDADNVAENRIVSWSADAEVYARVLVLLDKVNVLGGGKIMVDGKEVDTSSHHVSPSTGDRISSTPLKMNGYLCDKACEYFTVYHIKSQYKVSRTNADFAYPKNLSSPKAVEEDAKKRRILFLSVDKAELNTRECTCGELYGEIEKLLELYGPDRPDAAPPSLSPNSRKKLLVDSLIKLRTDVFENVDGAKEDAEKVANETVTSETTVQERKDALNEVWHKLPESIRTDPVFTKKYFI